MTGAQRSDLITQHYAVFAGVMSTNISSYFHGQVQHLQVRTQTVHRGGTVKPHGKGHKWVIL